MKHMNQVQLMLTVGKAEYDGQRICYCCNSQYKQNQDHQDEWVDPRAARW